MKVVYFTPLLLVFLAPYAFADNSLVNENLVAESPSVSLDIQFGESMVRHLGIMDKVVPTVNSAVLNFYGDDIDITDSKFKFYSNGNSFSVKNFDDGILIYGKYNPDLDNYDVNVYFSTDNGFAKYGITASTNTPDENIVQPVQQPKPQPEEPKYIPDLKITSSHDFHTYWKDTFDISVESFDGNLNSDPKYSDFDGRLDGANVTVLISKDDKLLTKLSGTTENNGQWTGQYFVQDNIVAPGEYIVDVIVSYLDKSVTQTSSMFIIGETTSSGGASSNPDTDGDGILDAVDACPLDPEDGYDDPMTMDDESVDGCPK